MPKIAPISWKILVRVFESFGFAVSRTSGDHVIMSRPGARRPVIVPKWDQVPVYIIRNNLRSAQIDRDEYLAAIGAIK